MEMMIMLNVCDWLKLSSLRISQRLNGVQECGIKRVKGVSGSAVIGSTQFGMKGTILSIWIIFIITRLNMAMLIELWIGRIQLFGIMSNRGYIRKIGQ